MILVFPFLFGLVVTAICLFLFFRWRAYRWSGVLLGLAVLSLIVACLPLLVDIMRVPTADTQTSENSAPPGQPPAALKSAPDYLAQGDFEFERGNYDAAVTAYTQAIQRQPNFAEAYNNRAYTYMTQKNYAAALSDLNRALELRPDYVNALMNRGDIHNYYYAVDYDAAIADYDKVIALGQTRQNSVCGHRLIAMYHGWTPAIYLDVLRDGVQAGCDVPSPG